MPIEKFAPRYTFTEDRLAQLKDLVPEAFADGNINWNTLKEALGEYLEEDGADAEHFGLTWPGKRQARKLSALPSKGALTPCPKEGINAENTEHVFIEGDNLEVLKLMQKAYAGRVKLIYIDPPYNTGNDFVYKDDYSEPLEDYLCKTGQKGNSGELLTSNPKSSGRYHSNWLNMMYPRLRLARGLLDINGVVLISIDDNEVKNLRSICDEIFGEENFIASMIWEKGRKNDAKLVSVGHEYILIYAKSLVSIRLNKTLWREEKPGAKDIWDQYLLLREKHGDDDKAIEFDLQHWFSSLDRKHPAKKWSRYKRVDVNGPWRDRDISWPGGGGPRYDVLHPETGFPCRVPERGWIYSNPEEMQRQISLGLVVFRNDHSEPPFRKAHIRPVPDEIPSNDELDAEDGESADEVPDNESSESEEELATQVRGSYFYKQSQVAVKHLRKFLGVKAFSNPKDHIELAKLFNYVTSGDKKAIIMDFFAGSGSTAHAVLELNYSDKGCRRYILMQLPEPLNPAKKEQKVAAKFCDAINKPRTIAEVAKERLRRVGKLVRNNDPNYTGDFGFNVFKLVSSQFRAWDDVRTQNLQQLQLAFESTETPLIERWDADTLFYEILLQEGFPLHSRRQSLDGTEQKVWVVTEEEIEHRLFVCLADRLTSKNLEALTTALADNDILVCFDRALTDETKAQLLDHIRLRVL